MHIRTLRTIVEEKNVTSKIEKAKKRYKRIEDVFMALTWRLAREPEGGYPVPNTDPPKYLMKIDSDPSLRTPGILVLYSYNKEKVNILSARIDAPKL